MIETYYIKRPLWSARRWWILGSAVVVLSGVFWVWWLTGPPTDFPKNAPVTIQRGLSAGAIASLLESHHVVRSELLLYLLLVWRHDPNNIQAGTYVYQEPLSVGEVARRLAEAPGAGNLLAVTLPEGFTAAEFATIASMSLPDFEIEEFKAMSTSDEGRLFPDTYYLPVDFTAAELHELLLATYDDKTAELRSSMIAHPLGEDGVLTLASLLEREANSEDSMRVVSGILQNRLTEGMRLQVDASLEYVLERPLSTLDASDLDIDSPYNTYRYGGLPPTPIGNPGLQAIAAVLDPVETGYFYYITDGDGDFHYARTFEEHRKNIEMFLK